MCQLFQLCTSDKTSLSMEGFLIRLWRTEGEWMIIPGGMNTWHGMASKVRHYSDDYRKLSDTEHKVLIK